MYERFRAPVWRLARRLTGDDEEALDQTQEIFLRVWRGLDRFSGRSKLSTWVFQIAWNQLRSRHRARGREPEAIAVDPGSAPVAVIDPSPGPERRASDRERVARLDAAIRRLPEASRATLWLRDAEGLSYAEISEAMGVPVGTVRSRLARARSTLKEEVDGCATGGADGRIGTAGSSPSSSC